MNNISEHRRETWQKLIEKTDMAHSSWKAWKTIKILSNDYTLSKEKANVTADQVAHQLSKNGKSPIQIKQKLTSLTVTDNSIINDPFTLRELGIGFQQMKSGKAAGLDDICAEQILHMGEAAKAWILSLFNHCIETQSVLKIWKKSRIIAVAKPDRDSEEP